jgi:hypothetical protein
MVRIYHLIPAADQPFLSPESEPVRSQDPELYERAARAFVELVFERQVVEALLSIDA